MTQDRTAKLLHEFLQMTDAAPPQLFCAHLAILAVKEAQSQASTQLQVLRDQHAAQLEQQQRDHEQRLSEHQAQQQQLLAEHAALQEQFTQQQAIATHSEKDAVWVDPKTGLMWSRISIGQQWQNGEAVGNATGKDWGDAQEACNSLRFAGFNDWRLPSREELETIMIKDKAGYNAPNGMLYPPDLNRADEFGRYWSASLSAISISYAWYVYFGKGKSSYVKNSNYSLVRAVRSIK